MVYYKNFYVESGDDKIDIYDDITNINIYIKLK